MDQKDKDKREVSDHELQSCKEKMKRSLLGSCKAAVVESMADEVIAAKNPTMRECDICRKIFGSGKALGGHRRSHFQKHQKKVKVRFTNNHSPKAGDSNNNNRANCDYDDDDGKRICCICKKEFPTKNALFGHMRSHPERSWRGVSPPTHSHKHSYSSYSSYSSSSSSLNSDSMEENNDHDDDCVGGSKVIAPDDEHHPTDVIDLSKFTSPSWLKTDIRGRKCIGGYEAAETLAYLSAYKYFCGESNRVFPKKDEVKPKSAPSVIKHDKRKIGESSSSKKHEVKKIKFYLKGELELVGNKDGAGQCDDEDGQKVNRCKGLSESGVERISFMDDEHVDEGFDDVNTGVTTPARVQDHFDERKKVKKMDQKGKSSKKMVLKSKGKDPEYENGSKEKVGGYKCGACGKIFSTFQGLGGHRSIHKEKNIVTKDESNHSDAVAAEENNSCSSSNLPKMDEALLNEETLADEACQSSGTKILDFDLNEPYVVED